MSNAFKPGDHAVHAVHGPGTITAVQMRDTPAGPVEYVSMEVGTMTIMLPTKDLEDAALRTPISREDAQEILALLSGDAIEDPGYTQRRRLNQSRLTTGDAQALAKIVRSLTALKSEQEKALAMRDMYDLRQATAQLVAELAISLDISEAEAEALVDEALKPAETEDDAGTEGAGTQDAETRDAGAQDATSD